jgi:hypothetical protein
LSKSSAKEYKGEILDLDFSKQDYSNFNYGKFVADYSLDFVKQTIKKYKKSEEGLILDPFTGLGTTNIGAKTLGFDSVGFDINPVNVWGNEIKLDWSISLELVFSEYENLVIRFLNLNKALKIKITKNNNLYNIKDLNKWLSEDLKKELNYLSYLIGEIKDFRVRKLFNYLLGKAALNVSNVEFCPGISFYVRKRNELVLEFKKTIEMYISDRIKQQIPVFAGMTQKEGVKAEFVLGSASDRKIWKKFYKKADLIITSPPYPNNIDYVAMSKLELYLHNFAKAKNNLTEIRKQMICSNAKLVNKQRRTVEEVCDLPIIRNIVDLIEIQTRDKDWGFNYAEMVEIYFSEMYLVMLNMWDSLVRNGRVFIVLGDQTVKGVKIRTAEILSELAEMIGFRKIQIEIYRNRGASTHRKKIDEMILSFQK